MKKSSKLIFSFLIMCTLSGALGGASEEAVAGGQEPTKQTWFARLANKRPFRAVSPQETKGVVASSASGGKELPQEAKDKLNQVLNEEAVKTPKKNWVHYTKITFKYLYKLVKFLLKTVWLGASFGTAVLKFVILFMLVMRGGFVPLMFSIAL